MIEVTDAIHRQIRLERPPRRVVSLVPSETLSLVELGGVDRLVGRTDYCVEPSGTIESVPSVGGTKGFDVEAVRTLHPDLVLANKEENSRPLVERLIAEGLTVHVSFPCTVEESQAYLRSLCALLEVDPDAARPFIDCKTAIEGARAREAETLLPVFVPIWKDPWMTFDGRAYASDILQLCGARNVFAERERRYPMAADLGHADAWSEERVGGRDTRYPRIRLQEIAERGARVVFLPNEPYEFGVADAEMFGALECKPSVHAELLDGKDLFWYGTHLARAVGRLSERVARARARSIGSTSHK